MRQSLSKVKAKPFLKWAGGKTQLLPTIDATLPENFSKEEAITYIEPFVGGGAMAFFMLQKYPNIKKAVINDINPHLTTTYSVVRDKLDALLETLSDLNDQFTLARIQTSSI